MSEKIAVTVNRKDNADLIRAGAAVLIAAVQGYSSTALICFPEEELPVLKAETEASGGCLALLINRLFHETETEGLRQFLIRMDQLGMEEIWFADPCVPAIREKEGLHFRCVYMPDTLLTSREDLAAWTAMGADEGVISPLLNLLEEKDIAADPHAVVPVHGHFLMARSYRKLLSAWQAAYGIKENLNGDHALTIREKKRDDHMPVYEDETGTLVYTDYVLDSFPVFSSLRREDGIYLISGVFMDQMSVIEAVRCYQRLIHGEDPAAVEEDYRKKCPDVKLNEGYYHACVR
jgi:collagenase-like PrtC family protease